MVSMGLGMPAVPVKQPTNKCKQNGDKGIAFRLIGLCKEKVHFSTRSNKSYGTGLQAIFTELQSP